MSDRLAPAQTDRPFLDNEDEGDGDYNIWDHRKAGKRKSRGPERGVQAKTRQDMQLFIDALPLSQ
jgi:hypothetical protein